MSEPDRREAEHRLRGRLSALVAISAADFLVVMEGFVVAVALPSMQQDLGLSQIALQWVFTAYALAFGGFLLLGGRLADLFGRRRVLICGFGCFAAGSLVAGLAPAAAVLVGGRALQGLGAAAMSPAALALLTVTFPPGRSRNAALGVWSGVGSVGIPAGALLGGLLTETVGWRGVLIIHAPVALLLAILARIVLDESREPGTRNRRRRSALDLPGAVTVTAGLGALIVGVTGGEHLASGSSAGAGASGVDLATALGRVVFPLAAAAVLLLGFIAIERHRQRRGAPALVDWSIFQARGLLTAQLAGAVLPVGLGALLFLGTQLLQQVLGFSAFQTSLAYLALAVPVLVASPVAARLTSRFGRRPVAVAGLLLQAAGLVLLLTVSSGASETSASATSQGPFSGLFMTRLLPAFVVVGAGAPVAYVPVTSAAVDNVGRRSGLASGLFNSSQQVGNAVALALMATAAAVASTTVASADAGVDAETAALASGLRGGLAVAAALCVAGALLCLRLPPRTPS